MITIEKRTVYRSTARGRSFLTKRAAIRAEADALIRKKYPTEKHEQENGYTTSPGWHWHELPRSEVLLRRLMRKLEIALSRACA